MASDFPWVCAMLAAGIVVVLCIVVAVCVVADACRMSGQKPFRGTP